MKRLFAIRISKHLLPIVLILFLAGMAFTFVSGSQSPAVIAAPVARSAGYLMLSGPDFGGAIDYLVIREGLGSNNGEYGAPLHLPQGANISEITTYLSASSPISFTTYISVESQRFDVFNALAVSVVPPITQTSYQTHQTPVISSAAIDNSQYGYRVRIRTPGSSSSAPPCPPGLICPNAIQANSNSYLIYQIRIAYTLDIFLPSITR